MQWGGTIMNGSAENRTSGSSERGSGSETVLTWVAACRMLPLVRQIVGDLSTSHRRLTELQPEKDRLDRHKRTLVWPERSRRYALQELIVVEEQNAVQAQTELEALGLALIDPDLCQVGFPTMVNNRKAFFSWRPGEESISYWHFSDESDRRIIPANWTKTAEFRTRTRG
jgi:hypothetical protein